MLKIKIKTNDTKTPQPPYKTGFVISIIAVILYAFLGLRPNIYFVGGMLLFAGFVEAIMVVVLSIWLKSLKAEKFVLSADSAYKSMDGKNNTTIIRDLALYSIHAILTLLVVLIVVFVLILIPAEFKMLSAWDGKMVKFIGYLMFGAAVYVYTNLLWGVLATLVPVVHIVQNYIKADTEARAFGIYPKNR